MTYVMCEVCKRLLETSRGSDAELLRRVHCCVRVLFVYQNGVFGFVRLYIKQQLHRAGRCRFLGVRKHVIQDKSNDFIYPRIMKVCVCIYISSCVYVRD